MELFNIENPYYEKWTVGRPSFKAIEKRKKYWEWEIIKMYSFIPCNSVKVKSITPKKVN